MNNYCNNCSSCHHDPCTCGECKPASYKCDFDIQANPYDASIWNVTICGAMTKVKIPKINETDTKLSTNYASRSLIYNAERHTDIISGEQLGSLIEFDDLRDVEVPDPDSCDLLVYNPYCDTCGDACRPKNAMWVNYHIPDAGSCVMEPDANGYYKVLKKNDCGCIVECKMPIMPSGMAAINYQRDSVPDDPDFPWYYGCYNDRINLHLADNAPRYFGKYDLKVTVNYGVQALKSDQFVFNYNWRSIVTPGIVGNTPERRTDEAGSILQNWAMSGNLTGAGSDIPWGSCSMRGSFTFIAPKGKEAYLHHEFRIKVSPGNYQYGVPAGQVWPNYLLNSNYDGKKVPDAEASLNAIRWPASRLNALQVIIEPTQGSTSYDPTSDPERAQLDSPVDDIDQPY